MRISVEIDKTLESILKRNGFKKNKYLYYKEFSDQCIGLYGLGGVSSYKEFRSKNCMIGIQNIIVEKIRNYLLGAKNTIGCYTIYRQLGYLMPEKRFKEWFFYEYSNIEAICLEIVGAIMKYGDPFIEHHKTIDSIWTYFEKDSNTCLINKTQVQSIILYIKGLKADGLDLLKKAKYQNGEVLIERIKEYRQFAEAYSSLPSDIAELRLIF